MELERSDRTLQIIGDTQKTNFGIGDYRMIIKHLTESTYSNALRAMVQEIMSNGRDAHIETGMSHTPITVKVPNGMYPTWEVRDHGPGLNPDRMHKVFTQYGNSTKRTDNTQSGGFGIGAKTPWAYTDTFTVTTVADETVDGTVQRVRRSYACVKGENYDNDLIESQDMVSIIDINDESIPMEDRQTGTVISVEIKEEDFQKVINYTIEVSEWWKVRPIITGMTTPPSWAEYNVMFENEDWKLIPKAYTYNYHNTPTNNDCVVCIDGIPYPFNKNNIKDLTSEQAGLVANKIIMFFKVGELDVQLSREQLKYTDRTCSALKDKMNKIIQEIQIQVQNKIDVAKDIQEASILFKEMNNTFSYDKFIPSPLWKTFPITNENEVYTNTSTFGFRLTRAYNHVTRRTRKDVTRFSDSNYLVYNNKVRYFLDDEGSQSKSKVDRYLDENNTIKEMLLVTITDPVKYKVWSESSGFSTINLIPMSSLLKQERQTLDGTGSYIRRKSNVVKAYLLHGDEFFSENVDISEGSGVYVEVERKNALGKYDNRRLKELHKILPDVPIYGIPTRFIPTIGDDWQTLENYLEEKYEELYERFEANRDDIAQYNSLRHETVGSHYASWIYELKDPSLGVDPLCPIFKYFELENWATTVFDRSLMNVYNTLNSLWYYSIKDSKQPNFDDIDIKLNRIRSECDECISPVFKMFDRYYVNDNFASIKEEIVYFLNKRTAAWIAQKEKASLDSLVATV